MRFVKIDSKLLPNYNLKKFLTVRAIDQQHKLIIKPNKIQGLNFQYLNIFQLHRFHTNLENQYLKYHPLHRYENIFNKTRFNKILSYIEEISQNFTILFVQHPATTLQLDKFGYRDRLEDNKNIELLPRLEYLPFIKLITNFMY